ncbi:facilitated trehalose transporter Tret1-like [Diachasmimorpha longicaudata]|uniref:facilitated trehalose transporter Tret1-like n=1 Tax=Diachasmimorpha longicaudata TaxID=58733 RepID=UPI0030B8E676
MKAVYSQYLIALAASSVLIPYGQSTAWLMVAIPALQSKQNTLNFTSDQVGWIASTTPIFTIVGSIISKYFMDVIGRRNSLILSMLPLTCNYILMRLNTFEGFIVGRALVGLSLGFSPVLSLYFGEIASDKIRGRVNFVASIVRSVSTVPVLLASSFLDLHTLNFYLLVPSIIAVLLLYMIPESPYFYLMKGDYRRAERALECIRDAREVSKDLVSIQHYVDAKIECGSSFELLWKNRGTTRAFAIHLWLLIYLQFSGTSVIKNYAGFLLENVGSPLDAGVEIAITMVITIIICCIAALFVDNLGRRSMLFLASIPIIIAMLIASVFYFLQETNHDVSHFLWIPWLTVLLINVSKYAGLQPLEHILMSEYYPLNIKATAMCLIHMAEALMETIVVKLFQESTDFMGFGSVFLICLFVYIIGTAVMYFVMPETNNLSFAEIETVFEQQFK